MEFLRGVPATHRDEIVAAGQDPVAIADAAVRASIKMLLIDGFFHADPHPGNVLVSLDTGVLTFIDTGMVGTLTLQQRFRLIDLLTTAGERDPASFAQALRGVSEPLNGRPVDGPGFDADFVQVVAPLMDVDKGEKIQLAKMMGSAIDLLRQHGMRPDPQLSLAMKAMTQAEEFTKVLYPPGSSAEFVEKATGITRELVEEAVTAESVYAYARKRAVYTARELGQNVPSLNEVAANWLRQLGSGSIGVKLDTSDLDRELERVDGIARLGTWAFLLVGLLIASAIAATVGSTGALAPIRQAALVAYAAAAVVAALAILALGWRLIRGR